jgi:hypothetical protein
MTLQSLLFGTAQPTQRLRDTVLDLLRQGERTARDLTATTGRGAEEVRDALADLYDRGEVATDPTDAVWFVPWTSATASCDRCRDDVRTLLCSCGFRRQPS